MINFLNGLFKKGGIYEVKVDITIGCDHFLVEGEVEVGLVLEQLDKWYAALGFVESVNMTQEQIDIWTARLAAQREKLQTKIDQGNATAT